MDLRVARHTDRLSELIAFYRDGLGLAGIGGFRDHDGYDGAFLDVPGTRAHLEFTSGGAHRAPAPDPESLLVLYLGDAQRVADIVRRLDVDPVAPANPHWARHGVTVEDPDGFRVVLVPERWDGDARGDVHIEQHTGSRAELRELFELAEDSARALDSYIDLGRVIVARDDGELLGHVQVIDGPRRESAEIKNMAVRPSVQRRGIGLALLEAAIAGARAEGRATLAVSTAAADVGNLRFYQRAGFRMRSIERDAFKPAMGYAAGVEIDGVALRDRVWLDLGLS
jgi:GNAT superfamily N-acetyltransferase